MSWTKETHAKARTWLARAARSPLESEWAFTMRQALAEIERLQAENAALRNLIRAINAYMVGIRPLSLVDDAIQQAEEALRHEDEAV